MSSYGGDGGYRPGVGDMPGGWAPGAIVKRGNAPNGMAVGIDFPFVCEVCLGPNPYVRMVKGKPGDKLCKISGRPFTSFRWRAGAGGRWKECMVEASVAKDKNICQACLVDMTYGVPVGVRDALLAAGADSDALAVATSDPNSSFYWQQKDALAASNPNANGALQNLEPSRQLLHMARNIQSQENKQSTAWRNLPKLCSFWIAGTCTRVIGHKCPFRPCNGSFEFPEIAATHKELRVALIERLKKEGAIAVMRDLDPITKEAIQNAGKGYNREEAIKKRYDGSDDLTKRYLRKAKEQMPELIPPPDQNITSLWVGGVEAPININDLKDVFYAYGEIRNIKIVDESKCAFIDFTTRQSAETAAMKLHNNLNIKGIKLNLDWAKASTPSSMKSIEPSGQVLPPPGLTHMQPPPPLPAMMQQRLAASINTQSYHPPPPPGPPPSKDGDQDGQPSSKKSRLNKGPPPPPPRPHYPSMDPTRLGAKTK